MRKLNALDWTAIVLLVIGGLNWGLVGLFAYDLVAAIFGTMTGIARFVYVLVGLSAIYIAVDAVTLAHKPKPVERETRSPAR